MSAVAVPTTGEQCLELMLSLPLPDGRPWGEAAAPFQLEDARAILAPEPGSPVSFHFLTRGRGASKTDDLGRMLAVELLRQRDARLYGLAADQAQGGLLLDSIAALVNRSPRLPDYFDVGTWKVSCPRTRSSLSILAADASGSWGLRPNFVVVDEFSAWAETRSSRTLWESVASSVAKVPGCRLVILTTAGDPSHFSARVLEHARTDPAWRVNEVPGPPPWMPAAALEAQERLHLPSTFRRLFWNEWVASEDRIATREDVLACVTHTGPLEPRPNRRYVASVDLGLKRDSSVATVCHLDRDRSTVIVDRIQVWTGSRSKPVRIGDVEDWLVEAHRSYGVRVVFDPWQAAGLAQRLTERRIKVAEFTFTAQGVGRLAVTLFNAIRNRSLAIPDDADLIDELSSVRLRETTPGVYRIDADSSRHDDRAIAIALAAQHLLERPARRTSRLTAWSAADAELKGESNWRDGTDDVQSSGPTWGSSHSENEADRIAFGWSRPSGPEERGW